MALRKRTLLAQSHIDGTLCPALSRDSGIGGSSSLLCGPCVPFLCDEFSVVVYEAAQLCRQCYTDVCQVLRSEQDRTDIPGEWLESLLGQLTQSHPRALGSHDNGYCLGSMTLCAGKGVQALK